MSSNDSKIDQGRSQPEELVYQVAQERDKLQAYLDHLSDFEEASRSRVSDLLTVLSTFAATVAVVAATNLLSYSGELLSIAVIFGTILLGALYSLTRFWRRKSEHTASLEMALERYRYLAVRLKSELNEGETISVATYLNEKKEADRLVEREQKALAKFGGKMKNQ